MTLWIGGNPDAVSSARPRGPRQLDRDERQIAVNVRRSRGGCAAHTVTTLACVVREDLSDDDFGDLLDTISVDLVSRGWLDERTGRFCGRTGESWRTAFVEALEYWTGAKWERVRGRHTARYCPSVARLERELRPSDAVACHSRAHVGALYRGGERHLLRSRHKVKDLFVQRAAISRLGPAYSRLLG